MEISTRNVRGLSIFYKDGHHESTELLKADWYHQVFIRHWKCITNPPLGFVSVVFLLLFSIWLSLTRPNEICFRKINARNASKQDIYELMEISWKIWNNPSKKTICIGKPARHNPGTVKIQAIADLGRTDVPADHGSDDQMISILFRLRPTKREGNTRLT